jgi:hypothetical protein
LVWLENSAFKRAMYRTFQNPCPQDPCGHPIDTFHTVRVGVKNRQSIAKVARFQIVQISRAAMVA